MVVYEIVGCNDSTGAQTLYFEGLREAVERFQKMKRDPDWSINPITLDKLTLRLSKSVVVKFLNSVMEGIGEGYYAVAGEGPWVRDSLEAYHPELCGGEL